MSWVPANINNDSHVYDYIWNSFSGRVHNTNINVQLWF